jgi:hypothetical protein
MYLMISDFYVPITYDYSIYSFISFIINEILSVTVLYLLNIYILYKCHLLVKDLIVNLTIK